MTRPEHRLSRRSFLTRATVGGAALTAGPLLVPVARLLPSAAAQQLDAAGFARFGRSLELAIVEVYSGITAALSEDLAGVAEGFVDHHGAHAEAFAEAAGERGRGEPNALLLEALAPRLQDLGTQTAALVLAKELENQVVATYAWATSQLGDRDAVSLVASILPAEAAHAATLSGILEEGPEGWSPTGAFETTDIAVGFDPNVFPAG